jgi:hypothetical protein
MNRKQLVTLIAALLIVGGIGLMVSKKRQQTLQESSASAGQKLFEQFPLNDVAQLVFTNSEGGLALAKVNDQWIVKERADFPANFTQLSDFVRKVAELKVGQPVKVGESQLGRLGLAATGRGTNSATIAEFKDKDGKLLATLALGKTHTKGGNDNSPFGGGGWPAGRYVMLPGKPQTAALVSESFSEINTKPDSWLNKDFFKVEKLRSISVTHPEPTNSWSLSRTNDTAEWALADPKPLEELDKNKVSGLNTFLSWAQFNDVEVGKTDADLGLDQPVKLALETFEGFKYDLTIGHKEGTEDQFVRLAVNGDFKKTREAPADEKPEDKTRLDKEFADTLKKHEDKLKAEQALGKWTYKVPKYSLDAGLKHRHELLVEKKPEATSTNAPPPIPMPVEIPGAPADK